LDIATVFLYLATFWLLPVIAGPLEPLTGEAPTPNA